MTEWLRLILKHSVTLFIRINSQSLLVYIVDEIPTHSLSHKHTNAINPVTTKKQSDRLCLKSRTMYIYLAN